MIVGKDIYKLNLQDMGDSGSEERDGQKTDSWQAGHLAEHFIPYLCCRTTMGEDVSEYVFENSDDDDDYDSSDSDESKDEQIKWSD